LDRSDVIDCYDKEGKPISMAQFSELLEDMEYKRVALDEIGPYEVSTVWLGLDHNWTGNGPPIIFETMVFTASAWNADRSDPDHEPLLEIDTLRYATETEALAGHHEVCTLIRATTDEEIPQETNGNK
jgi:hypothetical protein